MVWETIQKIKERFEKHKFSKIQKQKSFERSLPKCKSLEKNFENGKTIPFRNF
jgi:hypothetical protein